MNCFFYYWASQARRALRALRGLVRLKSLIQGQSVKRQAATTLKCMQTLARVQSQIRERRIRMSEENQALQRQLQQKRDKELEKLRTSVSVPILCFLPSYCRYVTMWEEPCFFPNKWLNCALAKLHLPYGFCFCLPFFYHSIFFSKFQ